jgi:hypothetical protein
MLWKSRFASWLSSKRLTEIEPLPSDKPARRLLDIIGNGETIAQ